MERDYARRRTPSSQEAHHVTGLTVGYAAMLEQFHPREAVELSAYA